MIFRELRALITPLRYLYSAGAVVVGLGSFVLFPVPAHAQWAQGDACTTANKVYASETDSRASLICDGANLQYYIRGIGSPLSVGIGTNTPASRFVVAPPTSEAVAGAAVITANACGTIKQITSTGNVTTNTTDTFTAPSASYAGCCMDVVNVDTTDTITLDANANFLTGGGTDIALGVGKAVRVCSDGTYWYQAAAVSSIASGGSVAISGLTAAAATNTIDNTNYAQTWSWSTLAGGNGLALASTSTAATGNTQKLFNVLLSGANANANQTTYAGYIKNTHTGTNSDNVGLYVEATGADRNYALDLVGGVRMYHQNGGHNMYLYSTPSGTNGGSWGIGVSDDGNGVGGGGKLFMTPDVNDSAASKLTILTTGNVGIGTNAPAALMELKTATGSFPKQRFSAADVTLPNYSGSVSLGDVNVTNTIGQIRNRMNGGTLANEGGLFIQGFTGNGVNNLFPLTLLGTHGGNSPTTAAVTIGGQKWDGVSNRTALTSTTPVLDVENNYGTAATTGLLFRIMGGGNVGIGTASPGYRLSVADPGTDVTVAGFQNAGGWSEIAVTNSTNAIVAGTDNTLGWIKSASNTPFYIGTNNTERMRIDASGNVGIGTTSPASKFVVAPPTSEAVAGAAVITANACGTIKQITSVGNVTTNTINTFTTPTASYAGCCMDVINVDTADTITLDANANFVTGTGADIAVGPGDGVKVCSNGTYWYQGAAVSSLAATVTPESIPLTDLTDAYADYTTLNNMIIGRTSAAALTAGAQYNLFIGQSAGATSANSTATTDYNIALGYGALTALTSGADNIAIGTNSLLSATSGGVNIAIGREALTSATTGSNNTAIGWRALRYDVDGDGNVAIGGSAMHNNVSSHENVAVGVNALLSNVTKHGSTAVGAFAMRYADSGGTGYSSNTALGYMALQGSTTAANNTGTNNTALGANTMYQTTSGGYNTAVGDTALYINSTGASNTALGQATLWANTTGNYNVAVGRDALTANTTGYENVAVGTNALSTNVALRKNVAIGHNAMRYADSSATGSDRFNTAVGHGAMQGSATAANNTGYRNTALGGNTMVSMTSGFENTALGYRSLENLTFGSLNVAVGNLALSSALGAEGNVAVGVQAGDSITTGTYNILIGHNVDTPANNTSNHLNIGGTIYGDVSTDNVRIGGSGAVSAGPLLVQPPASEAIAAAGTITANACGSIKPVMVGTVGVNDGDVTTSTTDTFTAPAAANAGCCMEIVNVETGTDDITLDTNGNFITGLGTNIIIAAGDAVKVCSNGSAWYQGAAVSSLAATVTPESIPITDLTDAFTDYTTDHNFIMGRTSAAALTAGAIENIFIGESAGASAVNSTTDTDMNLAIGYSALSGLTSGYSNVAIGSQSMGMATVTGSLNIAIGRQSLGNCTTCTNNVAIGWRSQLGNLTSYGNTSVGLLSLNATTGAENTAFGMKALEANSTGAGNVGIGAYTAGLNTTGVRNTAVGFNALWSNVTKNDSTAIGYKAMEFADDTVTAAITYNTALGAYALQGSATAANNTGTSNTALGHSALAANTSGSWNTALGKETLLVNTTGNANTAVGNSALKANTTGYGNQAVGNVSLRNNTTGYSNIAIGNNALYANVAKAESVAIGDHAMEYADSTATGAVTYNTAIGSFALQGSTTAANNDGVGNTAVGWAALKGTTTGDNNSAVGGSALTANTTGSFNAVLGAGGLQTNTIGDQNVAVGYDALNANTDGSGSVAIGHSSLVALTTGGTQNIALGFQAGNSITTGDLNIIIGYDADTPTATTSNHLNIGNAITGTLDVAAPFDAASLTINGNLTITGICTGCGGGAALSGLTVATATNTINNAAYAQEWQWNTLAGATALKLSSTSTAAAGNAQKMFEIALSGANGTATQTTYGGYITNTHTGTTSTNVGLYASASGGTNNYAALFPSGNVGIGTAIPGNALTVHANALSDAVNIRNLNAAGWSTMGFSNSAGVFKGAVGYGNASASAYTSLVTLFSGTGVDLMFATDDNGAGSTSERMRIKATTGYVGIGTSTPQNLLDIRGSVPGLSIFDTDAAISAANPAYRIRVQDNMGSGLAGMVFQTTTDYSTYNNGIVVRADGNVGLGISDPDELIDLASNDEDGLSIQTSTSGDPNWNPYIATKRSRGTTASPTAVASGDMLYDHVIYGYDGSAWRTAAMIEAVVDGTPGANDMPTRLEFQVQADGAGGWLGDGTSTPEMVIKNSGVVGIGVAAPATATRLQVEINETSTAGSWTTMNEFKNTVVPSGNTSANAVRNAMRAVSIVPVGNTVSKVKVRGAELVGQNEATGTVGNVEGGVLWGYNSGNATVGVVSGGWSGAESDSGTVTNVVAQYAWAGVGGGTVTNQKGIEIGLDQWAGTLTNRYGIYLTAPSGTATNDFGIYQAGTQKNYFAGNVGIGTSSPTSALHVVGDIQYTGVITDISDIRLKDNVRKLGGSLDRISALQPIAFSMKNDAHHTTEFGFSAQELQKVYPELVRTAPDEMGTLSVNYIGLIPPMVEAIKELEQQNKALAEQNTLLLHRLEALEKAVNAGN